MSDNICESSGRLLKGTGGLFTVLTDAGEGPFGGQRISCRARGNLRADGGLLPGDRVTVRYTLTGEGAELTASNAVIVAAAERKNSFIRPAMANLDRLYLILAAARPDPSLPVTDKLISVCEYAGTEPVIVIGKKELDPVRAEDYAALYRSVGYTVFTLSCATGEGTDEFVSYAADTPAGTLSAFAGASGAGKTSLLSRVFPDLDLKRGEVSRKTGRGRHTTRAVEIYEAQTRGGSCLIADTPGFSAVDFVNFDFMPFEALPDTMREFLPYYGSCRWPDCSHTKEEDCAVIRACREGKIAASRHESYLEMYALLKQKHRWD